MKLSLIFMLSFLISGLTGSLVLEISSYKTMENVLREEVEHHLISLTQSKVQVVDSFLENQKKILKIMSDIDSVEEALEKDSPLPKPPIEETINELNELIEANPFFYEIFILDENGIVVVSTNEDFVGENRFSDEYFIGAKNTSGAYIKDAYYSETTGGKFIAVSAPVFDDETKEFLGVIVIRISIDELMQLMIDTKGLGETEEIILVNREGFFLTPSRFLRGENKGVLTQKIDNENVENCLSMEEKSMHGSHDVIAPFLDYRGEEVVSTHERLKNMDWCLLVELEEKEAIDTPLKSFLTIQIIVSLVFIIIFSLIGFVIGIFFDKKYLARNKITQEVKQKKIANFLSKIKIRYFFLFGLIFAIGYFFLITSFFQGWQNAKFFDAIPDLIFFIIAFVVLGYAFKFKNKARRFLVWGAGLLCVTRLIEVPIQEYQVIVGTLGLIYWLPPFFLTFFGFLLVLSAFKEVVK